MNQLFAGLLNTIRGEVRFDPLSCELYSTDASIYQIKPLGVVLPKTREDILTAIQLCAEHHVPLIARGGGTSQTGAGLGRGIILDCSKYMRGVLEVNRDEGWARVEPGVVSDELNAQLQPSGMMFAVDISPSNRANIGGMCATNAGGSRSIRYGIMRDNVLAMDAVLADGSQLTACALSEAELTDKLTLNTSEGNAYRTVQRLAQEHRAAIAERYPKIQRRVGGYNLDAFVAPNPFNLKDILVGSEGTLAVTTEATVKIVPRPKFTALAVLHFRGVAEALESTGEILPLQPNAIELVDKYFLDLTRAQLELGRRLHFVQGDPGALLLVEFAGESQAQVNACVEQLEERLAHHGSYACTRALDAASQRNIWSVRKAGLGLLLGAQGDTKPFAFVEDSAVPPEHLAAYFRRFDEIVRENGTSAAYYGHASVGLLHIRPLVNLKQIQGVEQMYAIARGVTELALEYDGAISGEHGDGLSRSEFNERVFGTELYNAFRELKHTFDPQNIFNPGKITDAPKMVENLRFGAQYKARQVPTYFSFAPEGGFDRAIEMCNGNGECRKTLSGTMCPSYMVTLEEKHSTRGRANALRAAINGHLPADALTSQEVFDALDLCLECKGCKGECPSNVDMAKLKYEFLAQYYAGHGTPLRARLFGNIARLNQLGSWFAPVSNWTVRSRVFRWGLDRFFGIEGKRTLPPFQRQTFEQWFRARPPRLAPKQTRGKVAFFNDTYTNFNYPEGGRAAVRVLEALGYEVVLAEKECCGRPMISKGLIAEAKAHAAHNVKTLAQYAAQKIPVVGLEPSCLLTLREEYPDLVEDAATAQVAANAYLMDEFLARELEQNAHALHFDERPRQILFHGHCHQKALVGSAPSLKILSALPNAQVTEIDSGCCGMAGSFGFEKEHYPLSEAIGSRKLFPAIQKAEDALVVAPGVSCRQQIAHFTGRRALQPVEVLADALVD